MTQSTMLRTSPQRCYIVLELRSITKNSYFLPSIVAILDAAKHGPALLVIPVLIPDQSSSFSILLVFYHISVPSYSTTISS